MISKELYGNELIADNLRKSKWWRLYDLRGFKIKLKDPIDKYFHSGWKGDPNYIYIHSYSTNAYFVLYQIEDRNIVPKPWEISDSVYYYNELTEVSYNHTINLSLVDFNYLYNLLTNV